MRRSDREVIERSELEAILDESDVCRIALNTGDAPYIVPLNYGYIWNEKLTLYFHSAGTGRKIDLMKQDMRAGFEIDTGHELVKAEQACGWGMKYKSIIGTGNIICITDDAERQTALQALMHKYGYTGEMVFDPSMLSKMAVYKLEVTEMSGKQRK